MRPSQSPPQHCAWSVQVVIVAAAVAAAVVAGASADPPTVNWMKPAAANRTWLAFKLQFGRNYTAGSAEDTKRQAIYDDNVHWIAEHNRRYERGEVSFCLAINQYADLEHAEFVRIYIEPIIPANGTAEPIGYIKAAYPPEWLRHAHRRNRTAAAATRLTSVPPHRDWRRAGIVTAVRDQRNCGACWAMAAVGVLEAHLALHASRQNGTPSPVVELSVQQLLDCTADSNRGCGGGIVPLAYAYMFTHTMQTERSYPYRAADGECRATGNAGQQRFDTTAVVMSGNERQMRNVIGLWGPLSVSVDAAQRTFQFYAGGTYDEPLCRRKTAELNHVMLAVGYGKEWIMRVNKKGRSKELMKYWLLKNSMGSGWGEAGYMRLRRDGGNMCGVATEGTYPAIDEDFTAIRSEIRMGNAAPSGGS